tara:strand:+ start:260 stop:514 length:255 start_codon:yes stop_codon:yes gene_type:complete
MEKKIEEQELKNLQNLNGEFNKLKTQLGDLTLQEHGICLRVEQLKGEFQQLEKALMEKYGVDAVINLETGEVKEKEKEKDGEDK